MKTLQVDLNLLTDSELEAYLIVKKASARRPELPKMDVSQEQMKQNVQQANQGWMNTIPEPPKMPQKLE